MEYSDSKEFYVTFCILISSRSILSGYLAMYLFNSLELSCIKSTRSNCIINDYGVFSYVEIAILISLSICSHDSNIIVFKT